MHARRRSLFRRPNRSLVTVLASGAVAALVSAVALHGLASATRSPSHRAAGEAAFVGTLQAALHDTETAGRDLVTTGSEVLDRFTGEHGRLAVVLDDGARALDGDDEREALAALRAAVGAMYEPLLVVAADPDVEVDVAALQDHLGVEGQEVRSALYELEALTRRTAATDLAGGEQAQRRLAVALAVAFGLSLAATLHLARRTRRGAPDTGQLAALAETLDAMAELLGGTRRELEHQVAHDALTGAATRRAFVARLDREIGAGALDVGVVFVDLDDVEQLPDTHGDQVLQQVAARIGECVRASDVVARFGADQFAVLLAAPADHTVASAVAARILDRLGQPIEISGGTVHVAASVGVALRALTGGGGDELMEQAGTAMSRARRSGKNRYEVFTGG